MHKSKEKWFTKPVNNTLRTPRDKPPEKGVSSGNCFPLPDFKSKWTVNLGRRKCTHTTRFQKGLLNLSPNLLQCQRGFCFWGPPYRKESFLFLCVSQRERPMTSWINMKESFKCRHHSAATLSIKLSSLKYLINCLTSSNII